METKLSAILKFLLLILFSVSFSSVAHAQKRIGILRFSDENRYILAAKAFREELARSGFKEPEVTFVEESSGGSKVNAGAIVKKFAASKFDLIFTLGTSATIAITQEIKETPVVFSTVYDPVAAGIARDWDSSGNNTTGTCSKISMNEVPEALKELGPIRKLAVIYTPGEKNSEIQLKELRDLEKDYQITIIPIIASQKEDLEGVLPEVAKTADAIFVTGSNALGPLIPFIVDFSCQAKMITACHLDDLVEKGLLLGVCSDSSLGGQMAGEKAVRILKGEKPDKIPIEWGKKIDLILNRKTAGKGQFVIPASFTAKVSRFID